MLRTVRGHLYFYLLMTHLSGPLNACPIKCDRVHIDCQNAYFEYSEKKRNENIMNKSS